MWFSRNLLKYGAFTCIATGAVGTTLSLKCNALDSIGVVRFGRASFTAMNIVFYYKRSLYAKEWDVNSEEYKQMRSQVHKRAAEKLLKLCQMNKGVYVKVGQHIGALDYILPVEYVSTMKILHSQAPASTIQEVYQVLQEDLHLKNVEDVFDKIEPEPIGAASLAQVHKAYLKNGHVVALKVQHPSVKGNSVVDLKTMEILANVVSWVLPDFKMQWLVEETKRNIPNELNFQMEAENTDKARAMFQCISWLKIPNVHWDLCSPRVLALQFLEGAQINDLEYIKNNGINPYEVSDKLGQLYSEMIFKQGFVHSDPHPGNILVQKNESGHADLILLDHGLYARLTDDFRYEYAQLWLSILNRNKDDIKKYCAALGEPDLYWLFAAMVSGRSWDAIQSGLVTTEFNEKEKEQFQKEIPYLLTKISEVMTKVNRQMILILKTNDLLRGIEHTLHTYSRMGSFATMTRTCIQTVYTEKKKHCSSSFQKWRIIFSENLALIKLSLYYKYLYFLSYFNNS